MSDILFSALSFLLGALAATLYRKLVANDTDEALEDAESLIDDLRTALRQAQDERDELRKGLDALGRVDLGG